MSYDLLLQKAVDLHNQGNFDEAEILYRQILETAPKNPIVLNLLGMIAQSKNAHNQAIELLYAAQKHNPNEPMYPFNLGFSLLQIGKFSEAEASFSKALNLSANFKEAAYYLGICAEKKGDITKANFYYHKALEIDSSYVDPKLALSLLNDGLRELLVLDEEICNNYLIKANISKKYFDTGDLSSAIDYAKKAYELNPDDDEITTFYATLLLENNQINEAEQLFEFALKINSKNISTLINLANISAQNNNQQKAEDLYRQAIDISPKNFDAHLNFANLLFNQNRKAEALDEYREAAIINPQSAALSRNLAALLCEEEEYEEALGLLFNALNQKDSNAISINIAETLTLLAYKDKETALKIAENWCRSMPDNTFAKHTLSALKGEKIEDNKIYSECLFDAFADNYDEVLQRIDYSVARRIAELIRDIEGTIIDLGCGSGLVGTNSLNFQQRFIGVDISAKMLEKAKKTGRYERLIKSDILEYLETKPQADLLIAADVLCYFSNLNEFFKLTKGYKLCFSVEALENSEDFALLPSGRCAHNKRYIKRLLAENGFGNIKYYEETIRYENGLPIKGYIFTVGL